MAYWLMKTEPETFSFEQLIKDKRTNWNGVRNYQARNNLRAMKVGDIALIYHSGKEKAVVGISKVIKAPYPDFEGKEEWVQVDVAPVEALKFPVNLATIKSNKDLKSMPLVRLSRLSVMPLTAEHYKKILKISAAAH